jgi:FAD/FMN-containing dehydrogenase
MERSRRTPGRSWGRYPRATHTRIIPVTWRSDPPPLDGLAETVLPHAWGRSYGDSCLNHGGALLDTAGLDRFISLDQTGGLLRCEAGVTLADILALIVPRGWFLPVLPGTRWVSVGGAIANDIHGKNHHRAGSFGAHVTALELLRSSGERLICDPSRNADLFRATIGGLGLTGLILWAELRLVRVPGPGIALERIRYPDLDAFLELSAGDAEYEYTVAWLDCLARGRQLGRGVYLRGDHAELPGAPPSPLRRPPLRVPVDAPPLLLNRWTLSAFNAVYYRRAPRNPGRKVVPYDRFFFPLDGVDGWNRLYGRPGFVQYQCVVPEDRPEALRALLERVSHSGQTAGLGVLKRFGDAPAAGLLSFPRPGFTLAVDIAFRGEGTLDLLEALDAIVRHAGGAVYPAKDARMSAESFRAFFPGWETFRTHVDLRFSSSFWRRVNTA